MYEIHGVSELLMYFSRTASSSKGNLFLHSVVQLGFCDVNVIYISILCERNAYARKIHAGYVISLIFLGCKVQSWDILYIALK